MNKIILASSSPRRKALLNQIGLHFEVIKPEIEEKLNPRLKPKGNAEQLSLLKAQAAYEILIEKNAELGKKSNKDSFIIIAADTFVVFQDEILGKPEDKKAAKKMLMKLSGNCHTVITGYTILEIARRKIITKSIETKVFIRKMSLKEIDDYIKTGEPMDKAGAYAMQEKGAVFVERIEGDPFNVVGLPLQSLTEELKKFAIKIL